MSQLLSLEKGEQQEVDKLLAARVPKNKFPITLNDLIASWADFVKSVEHGYDDTIYDYHNMLSKRDVLESVASSVRASTRSKILEILQPWDERFLKSTRELSKPLLPMRGTLEHGKWWFRIPLILVGELRKDMQSEGLV